MQRTSIERRGCRAPHERYSLDMIRKHAWVQRGSAVTLTVLPLQPPYKSLFLDERGRKERAFSRQG